jgi:hypothetical protein
MATTTQIKTAIAASPALKERVVLDGLLKIVEIVKSRDPLPDPRFYGSLVTDFFRFRQAQANTIANQARLTADNTLDFNAISNLPAILLGFASDLVDRIEDQSGGNPWASVGDDDVEATAAAIVAGVDDAALLGGVELSFNGLSGITRAHMEQAVDSGLWSHPFGLPQIP